MAIVLPEGRQSFTTATGAPGVGYRLYAFFPGTSSPKDTYTTSVGDVQNAHPVVANARGEMTIYWSGTYDVVLRDSNDALIWGPERLEDSGDTLRVDLASTASASLGDALVGTRRNISGSVATTVHGWIERREVDAEDFTSIQAALNSGAAIVNLTATAYNISTALAIPAGVTLRGRGLGYTFITLTADVSAFTVTNVNDTLVEDLCVIVFATQTAPIWLLTASTVTVARNYLRRVQVSSATSTFEVIKFAAGGGYGIWNNHAEMISCSGVGTVVKMGTTAVGSWVRENSFTKFYVNGFIYGVDILNTAGDGASENVFDTWGAQTSASTLFCVRIPAVSVIGVNQQNSFNDVAFYDLQASAVQYYIGANVRDTSITGATGDPPTPLRFTDNGLRTRFTTRADFLSQLLASGRYQPVPTSVGWTQALIGSATTAQQATYLQLRTGTTNPSTARAYTEAIGGMCSTSVLSIDFGKKFILGFGLSRATSEAAAVGRVQLKQVQTSGALAAAGLGVQVDNLAMTGESYGAALGGVNIGNLTDGASSAVMIIHYPGVRTEWWVNGAFTAQQVDTTKIPSGAVACYLVSVLGNNSASDCQLFVTQPWIWADLT